MPWTTTAVRSLIAGAAVLAGGCAGFGGARAADDAGGGRSVFAPSPLPAVRTPKSETLLLDLNVTGRDSDAFPSVDGGVSLEIQNDYNAKSDKKDNEVNDLTSSNDLFLAVRAAPGLSLQGSFAFEDVGNPKPGQNRYFKDMGVFVETLGLAYQIGPVTLFGGKLNPTFGVAWDLAPGIYGADLADDYELTERIGAGGAMTLGGGGFGRHTLTGQAFFLDTSVLSQSWGTERGRTTESDGGVSNTETLQSFSVTLDGDVLETIDGLRYQLGFERQQRGRSQPDNEWGVATALYGSFELTDDIDIEPVVEWAWIRNYQGEPNTVNYLTAGAGLYVGPWNVAVSSTGRFLNPRDSGARTDPLYQISAGYEFDSGFSVNLGYAFFDEDETSNNVIGALLLYDFDFRIR